MLLFHIFFIPVGLRAQILVAFGLSFLFVDRERRCGAHGRGGCVLGIDLPKHLEQLVK